MNKKVSCFLVGVPLLFGTAGGLAAQEMGDMRMRTRASLFDIGVYAGGAVSTNWYSSQQFRADGLTRAEPNLILTPVGERTSHGIGLTSAFGGAATFWGFPWAGLRLHYAYLPSEPPTRRDGFGGLFNGEEDFNDGLPQNNHFYDLNLVFRLANIPLFSRIASNAYAFVGGGGFTADIASGARNVCEAGTLARGACFHLGEDKNLVSASKATVGQGVVGIGGDIFSLTNALGLFVELAAHGYDSPVHVGDDFVGPVEVRRGQTVAVARDKFAVTTRLVGGLKLLIGAAAAAPAPLPPPPPPPPAAPMEPAPMAETPIRVCILEGGQLREVDAMVNPATGDTLVAMAGERRRFADAYPATTGYAGGADFFVQDRPIRYNNRNYVRFGLTRIVPATEVRRIADFQGTTLFAETGANVQNPDVLYVLVRPGCEFQPYQRQEAIRPRG
ncbi:MAG: hypothetical protein H0V06_03875 [Gemmatimonadetes bacterium]|nr:hypothetical protein [Gemmatimonadota bacterium]